MLGNAYAQQQKRFDIMCFHGFWHKHSIFAKFAKRMLPLCPSDIQACCFLDPEIGQHVRLYQQNSRGSAWNVPLLMQRLLCAVRRGFVEAAVLATVLSSDAAGGGVTQGWAGGQEG